MIEVTTVVECAGQFVISGAQLVTVTSEVLKTVDVVIGTPVSVGTVSVGAELVKLTERLLGAEAVSTTVLL